MAETPREPLCTRDSLAEDLRALGVRPGGALLVHSSLSSLGWVVGGAVTAVEALMAALGAAGTLVVPTHTSDNSDPGEWGNPPVPEEWWPVIRAHMPPYDPRITPSRGMGAIAETVRTWPGAQRSAHPQTSFSAHGPLAEKITGGHALDCRLGEDSPLARLEEADAQVLLLGAGYDSCTCFHLAEYRLPPDRRRTAECACAVSGPAGRAWRTFTDTRVTSEDFAELGAGYETAQPVTRGRVGGADSRLFPLRDAVAYAQAWLRDHR
ncbi:aminoglycoside N(3)-acetyltransferase [Phaeacidiphilus oryzae]|uniref:aminoglycoside N(3)-acetyltransferase n=1 Tax=Phaeacidiphilus oryzae TaxID=348818 RepID=UPI00056845FC|nr:AAC(3) family N-acetyltransferase [Phaeacidiphilus oryzae]